MDSEDTVCISDELCVRRSTLEALKAIDAQLALLAVLTLAGVKPLSRWEKPLGQEPLELLRGMGLHVGQVRRTALNGTEVTETLFGRGVAYLQIYQDRWEGRLLDKSAEAMRFEGFLFGYPPCCVEAYIRSPYAPNDIDPAVQARLFHWACKGCVITPLLLPVYQRLEALLDGP